MDDDFYFAEHESLSGLALCKQSFDNAHLWVEQRIWSRLICFSDPLMQAIREAELKLPKPHRMREI